MASIVVIIVLGYVLHLTYKLFDIGFIFLAKFVSKLKKDKSAEKL